jgi:hypothetical protein
LGGRGDRKRGKGEILWEERRKGIEGWKKTWEGKKKEER